MRRTQRAPLVIALGLLSVVLMSGSCETRETPSPIAATLPEPGAARLVARTNVLKSLAAPLAQIQGTPLASRAESLATSLPDCEFVTARADSGKLGDLWSSVECAGESDLRAGELGASGLQLAWPTAAGPAVANVRLEAGGDAVVEIVLPDAAVTGLSALTLPGTEAAGATQLSGSMALVHARVRPAGGLDLATLVPPDSQGAQMFRLKSELFAGLVLAGVWEIAIYLPEERHPMPRAALALEFTHRGAAVAAIEQYVADLERTWPVHRTFFRIGEADGACLLDLNLLPDLAPCYVATDQSLVIGWNPGSLRKALDVTHGGAGGPGGLAELEDGQLGGAAVVDFDQFPRADRILARAAGFETDDATAHYPWQRWVARGVPSEDGHALRVHLHRASPQ